MAIRAGCTPRSPRLTAIADSYPAVREDLDDVDAPFLRSIWPHIGSSLRPIGIESHFDLTFTLGGTNPLEDCHLCKQAK